MVCDRKKELEKKNHAERWKSGSSSCLQSRLKARNSDAKVPKGNIDKPEFGIA